jgi:hypothetical protein
LTSLTTKGPKAIFFIRCHLFTAGATDETWHKSF